MLRYKCCDHVLIRINAGVRGFSIAGFVHVPLGMFVNNQTPMDVPVVTKCPKNQNI